MYTKRRSDEVFNERAVSFRDSNLAIKLLARSRVAFAFGIGIGSCRSGLGPGQAIQGHIGLDVLHRFAAEIIRHNPSSTFTSATPKSWKSRRRYRLEEWDLFRITYGA